MQFGMDQREITMERDKQDDKAEEGVVVPLDRINPETLRKMIEEFVTREWSELSDAGYTFENKIEQVIQQLKDGRANVVFDLLSETFNIIPLEGKSHV